MSRGDARSALGDARDASVDCARGGTRARCTRRGVGEPRREASDIVAAILDQPRLWPPTHGGVAVTRPRSRAHARRRRAARDGAPFAYAVARAPSATSRSRWTSGCSSRARRPRSSCTACSRRLPGTPAASRWTSARGAARSRSRSRRRALFARVIGTDLAAARWPWRGRTPSGARAAARAGGVPRTARWLAPLAEVRARVGGVEPAVHCARRSGGAPALGARLGAGGGALQRGLRNAATSRFIREAPAVLEPGGLLALEVDSRRASLAAELALADGRYRDVSREARPRGTRTIRAGETRRRSDVLEDRRRNWAA